MIRLDDSLNKKSLLYNPVSVTTPDFVAEGSKKSGGSSAAKYVTKPIVLTNNSTALDIRISADVPSTSEVEMYLEQYDPDDARSIKRISLQMTMVLLIHPLHQEMMKHLENINLV